ncbi:UDP-glucose dehydrogenase family protein [Paenibacillus hodogayensis]|uniref:UDP-glucose 6-dehydrogenase n=1 Tax=Paenibacillus hodogayensis TaxID=279208 RepID=A0ABV5VSZ5_9BACL
MADNLEPFAISIFGLGYVGCVSAGCLAQMGHRVYGVDTNPHKAELIRQGKPTIVEKGMEELIASQVEEGRLRIEPDIRRVVALSDITIVCVGTPSGRTGLPDLSYIWHVARQIRDALTGREHGRFYTVMIRSTVPPGTCLEFERILAESGLAPDRDFAVVSNPEFLREGSSIQDYYNPPYSLLGTTNPLALAMLRRLYEPLGAPVLETERETAEMIKYVNNSFHALKVVFANEIGALCKAYGVDSHRVMELFCHDRSLNISPAYLMPGFAYGGSCLPKDLRALNALARQQHVELSVLSSVERSNELQIERALELIIASGHERIGVLGLAFKSGTDDLRESPVVKLLELLIGKGYEVMIYDPHVLASRLVGANKQYMETAVPHLTRLLARDPEQVAAFADAIVIAQRSESFRAFVGSLPASKTIIDLVRALDPTPEGSRYHGLLW